MRCRRCLMMRPYAPTSPAERPPCARTAPLDTATRGWLAHNGAARLEAPRLQIRLRVDAERVADELRAARAAGRRRVIRAETRIRDVHLAETDHVRLRVAAGEGGRG